MDRYLNNYTSVYVAECGDIEIGDNVPLDEQDCFIVLEEDGEEHRVEQEAEEGDQRVEHRIRQNSEILSSHSPCPPYIRRIRGQRDRGISMNYISTCCLRDQSNHIISTVKPQHLI